MKNFLLLGSNSQLASCFQSLFSKQCIGLPKQELDITDKKALEHAIKFISCPYVINFAAITDIEYCETNPQKCFDVNTIAVHSLDELCRKYKKKLIHISSDYAHDPQNVYGLSKYISENICSPQTLTIRTNYYSKENYIVKNLLQNKQVNAYTNIFVNPISIINLVRKIENLKNENGVLNIFTNKKISWYDFSLKFCMIFEIENKLIKKKVFSNNANHPILPLSSYIKPDITINIDNDLIEFKKYLKK